MLPAASRFHPITKNESAQLDSLRGISAILVVIGHANQVFVAPSYGKFSPWLGLLAQSAVMAFFVLSGFLIGKSVSNNIAKHNGVFSLTKYLGDRIMRIWPPLCFSILLVIFLYYMAPLFFSSGSHEFLNQPGHTLARQVFAGEPKQLLGAALALNGFFTDTPDANGPLWSLSIEVWYYLLAAIIVWPSRWWKFASIPAVIALCFIGWNNDQFFYYLPVWWVGYCLSALHDRSSLPRSKCIWLVALSLLAAAIVLGAKSLNSDNPRSAWHFLILFNVAIGFFFATILALILTGRAKFSTAFQSAAPYSYTLYIIHFPVFLFIFGIAQPWIQDSLGKSLLVSIFAVLGIVVVSRWVANYLENRQMIRSVFVRTPSRAEH